MTEQSIIELLSSYNRLFLEVHGFKAPYVPPELTKEWLLDQLHALNWYARYENAVMIARKEQAIKAASPAPKKKSIKKVNNPFL